MSRTRKGSKGPGWEPWSNRNERQQPIVDDNDEHRCSWDYSEDHNVSRCCSLHEVWEKDGWGWALYSADACPRCND